ncbi:hypothetical protein GCM10023165_32250 [Variovorax defluvii]|uniref:S-adenosyl-L-methionine-dependent methyltransferase n=1 Tax=Variovorax defluvii TaxID=913761 RepID=A0ABP8HYC0_9BURK
MIAAGTLMLAGDPRTAGLVAPEAPALCERLLSGSLGDRLLAKSTSFAPTRRLWRMAERFVLPGVTAHFWHRKRWIERRVRQSLAEGFQRVVIIGAGFDTLALRLAPQFPGVDWIEIDHPATQRAKQHALGCEMDGEPAANLRFIAADLAAEALPTKGFDDGRATLVIAEGLLMYLAPAAVEGLFRALAALRAPTIRILFSFMSKWPDGSTGFRPRSPWVERWLAWRGEPFTWFIEPERIGTFLQPFGFAPLEVASTQDLADEAGSPCRALAGENLVLCQAKSA